MNLSRTMVMNVFVRFLWYVYTRQVLVLGRSRWNSTRLVLKKIGGYKDANNKETAFILGQIMFSSFSD